eukprot:4031887-Prymnesium_polylepis.2
MPEFAIKLTRVDGFYDQVLRTTTYMANPAKIKYKLSVEILDMMLCSGSDPGKFNTAELAVVASKDVAPWLTRVLVDGSNDVLTVSLFDAASDSAKLQ